MIRSSDVAGYEMDHNSALEAIDVHVAIEFEGTKDKPDRCPVLEPRCEVTNARYNNSTFQGLYSSN
jgi:hypothetical protein